MSQPPPHGYPQPQPAYPQPQPAYPRGSSNGDSGRWSRSALLGIASIILAALALGPELYGWFNLEGIAATLEDSAIGSPISAKDADLGLAATFLAVATVLVVLGLVAGILGRSVTLGKIGVLVTGVILLTTVGGWASYALHASQPEPDPVAKNAPPQQQPPGKSSGTTAKPVSTAKSHRTRETTWKLATTLAFSALARTQGAPADVISKAFEECKTHATALGTTLPPLPKLTNDKQKDGDGAIKYLLEDTGKTLFPHLGTKYGGDHAALAELAFKAHMMNLVYQPGEKPSLDLAAEMDQLGPKADVPVSLVKGFTDAVRKRISSEDLQKKEDAFEDAVSKHLAAKK